MFKTKSFLIGVLVTLIVIVSGLSFAYWANNVANAEEETDGTVKIGTGKDVTTRVEVGAESGQHLVPAGRADDSNESDAVEFVVLEYKVYWIEDGDQAEGILGKLTAAIDNIAIGGDKNLGSYAVVDIVEGNDADIYLNGEEVIVKVEVTLLEPKTRADYLAVAGKTITFDISFSVEVV